jgi:jasmonate ZIM domain-containing protein
MTFLREKEKRQLTIFYAGKVLVFDNFPAEKANDLMQMAGKGASVSQNSALLPSPAVAAISDSTKVAAVPAAPVPLVSAQKNAAGNSPPVHMYLTSERSISVLLICS